MIAKVLLVIAFVAVAVAVGIYCRRHTGTVDGFILGGGNVGPWMSAFAYGTSYFSAVVFVGYAGQFGFKYGISATWAGIGNAIIGSLLAWWVLGPRTREMTHRLQASTMPEFFGKRYDSRALRIAAAAIIFVFLIPYTASVYNGLSRLFGMAFALPYDVCVIGMAVVTCIYVVLGGYMATVMNDFIQGIVMLLGIIAVIVAVILNNGGFSEAIISLSQIPAEGSAMQGPFVSFFGPDLFNLLGVVILTSLGTWGLPQMIQKYFGIKDDKQAKRGIVISTFFALLVAGGGYFIGSLCHLFFTKETMPVQDYIVPTMLKLVRMPSVLLGVVLVLLIAASVSTLCSITLSAGSTLSMDLIKARLKPSMTDKSVSSLTKVLCVIFVIGSYVVANTDTPILDMMSYSWGIISGSFLAPYVVALYWKRMNRSGAWAGMWSGFLIALVPAVSKLLSLVGVSAPIVVKLAGLGPVFAVAAMIVSLLLCFAVSAIDNHARQTKVNTFFYDGVVEQE